MTLNDAAIFVAVVQAGSFSAAAKELRMPTSTVSRSVSNLEARLGTQLLHRSTRSMALTDLGQRYFDEVEGAVIAIKDAAGRLTQDEARIKHRLKLIASPDMGTEILPEILVPFRNRYPNVLIDVELTVTPPSLSGQKFDLAIWGGDLPNSNLMCVTLQNDDFGLYAAPAYLARNGSPNVPGELIDHDCVLLRPEHSVPSWKLVGPEGSSSIKPPPTFTANDMAFLRNIVLQGGGIGPLPTIMVRHWEASGALVRVLPDHVLPGLPLYLLQPRHAFRTRASEALKHAVKQWSMRR